MPMAVFVLLVVVSSSSLSIFLPLFTDAVADYAAYCDSSGSGRSHVATARALVGDLKDKVPDKPGMQYCNVLTWPPSSGRQVFGYGSCDTVGRTADATYACRNCLATAGDALFRRCRKRTGGAGEVKGPMSLCYLKIGTSSCASMIH